MTGLARTLAGLQQFRRRSEQALANLAEPLRLTLAAPQGRNPGELRMPTYLPASLTEGAPLVVVLHGCTQNAAAYDHASGWSRLADRHGFALLFPEQQRGNNAHLCFNWFEPQDTRAGDGEVESIREMVLQLLATRGLDRRRVFITGLSAGGAMTAAMLATSPDLFAAGAIIAGLPYGAASSLKEALAAMQGQVSRPPRDWGSLVRAARPDWRGRRPAVQIWQGDADHVVAPRNAMELVAQWTDALGLPLAASRRERADGAERQVWFAPDGSEALQLWSMPGLGHGVPVAPGGPALDERPGIPGPHMLAAKLDATYQLARGWGLLRSDGTSQRHGPEGLADEGSRAGPSPGTGPSPGAPSPAAGPTGGAFQPGAFPPRSIEKLLRAAGLLPNARR